MDIDSRFTSSSTITFGCISINFPFLQLFTVFCPPDIFPQPLNTQMASDGCNVTIVVNIKAKRMNFIFTFTQICKSKRNIGSKGKESLLSAMCPENLQGKVILSFNILIDSIKSQFLKHLTAICMTSLTSIYSSSCWSVSIFVFI